MSDQAILFLLLFFVFVFLIWGRWRYDLVAFSALLIAVVVGVVPVDAAFSGFGHPAVVVIALVLMISRGLSRSGVIELLARQLLDTSRRLRSHIGIMAGVAAALSAVMNNVAALALLMPLDIQAANKAGRSPALSLMPLSFASILGGMITLIGTPPNIVIAEYRGDALGESYGMFDFTPVGLAVAVVGVVEPGAREAVRRSRTHAVGVLGTRATIKSRAYERVIQSMAPEVHVMGWPCPLLVPLAGIAEVRAGDWFSEELFARCAVLPVHQPAAGESAEDRGSARRPEDPLRHRRGDRLSRPAQNDR